MNKSEQIRNLFPTQFQKLLSGLEQIVNGLQEIRIRVNCPCIFVIHKTEYFPSKDGTLHRDMKKAVCLSKDEIDMVFNHICKYSPYAYENQLKQGFLTVAGGHRIGVCGQAVMKDNQPVLMKHIEFLHIRIVHEIPGVGQDIMPYLYHNGRLRDVLIVSPPGAGKTTMLRDLTKSVSEGTKYGKGKQVCLIDERSEIAGCYMGVPQNSVGWRTDVLDACPKALGMMMAIRAMGPEVLVVDELGLPEDYEAIRLAAICGIKLLASAHGESINDIFSKNNPYRNIVESIFERIIFLNWKEDSIGKNIQCFQIYDKTGNLLAEKRE